MANKNLFKSTVGPLIRKMDAINSECAPAYALDAKAALAQYAATGCMNGTFYASAGEQLDAVLKLCEQVDPQFIARTFKLEIVDSIEAAPGSEPDAKKLEELIATAKQKNVRVIAVEPQYDSNTSAKVILNALKRAGIDAEFAVVDPLETARADELNAEYYERKMRENVRNLADKLK